MAAFLVGDGYNQPIGGFASHFARRPLSQILRNVSFALQSQPSFMILTKFFPREGFHHHREGSLTIFVPPKLATDELRSCTFNLFRNRQRPQLICAVPEDRLVPNFVTREDWLFERHLRPGEAPPPGFSTRAATVGLQYSGFYLFQLLT